MRNNRILSAREPRVAGIYEIPLNPFLEFQRSTPVSSRIALLTIDVHNGCHYYLPMIVSFRDSDTRLLWETGKSRRIPAKLRDTAWKRLAILNAAVELENLKVPPGNRLEALKGNRKGQHSIRVNDQYRICFEWRDKGAHHVEIVDYH